MARSAAASNQIRTLCEEVLAWQAERKVHKVRELGIPSQHSEDDREAKLGNRLKKALLRRFRALGTKPSETLLNEAEVAMVNAIPGVPAQGCSVSPGALARASQSIDMAAETPAALDNRPASKRLRLETPPSTSSKAVTLCMRGLNIQWPFSQLILMGAKLQEVRGYVFPPLWFPFAQDKLGKHILRLFTVIPLLWEDFADFRTSLGSTF